MVRSCGSFGFIGMFLGKVYEPLKPMVSFLQRFRSNDMDDQSLFSFGKHVQPLMGDVKLK